MKIQRTEPYLSEYLHAKRARLGLPVAGNFELTARCNFNCPMCYVHMSGSDIEKQGGELNADEWLSIAEQAQKRGMVFVLLTGGEPLLRKDFFEIYEGMKKLGLLISINSNGSLIEGDILERFAENPPFRFNISLYGSSDETYMQMCKKPYFERVVNNIRKIKERGIDVRLNVSLTPCNCGDIEGIYRTADELGVHVKASSYMYPQIRPDIGADADSRMAPEEAARASVKCDTVRFSEEEFISRAKALEKGASDSGECAIDSEEGVSCRAGSSSFWITWDGKMLPCGMMPAPAAYPLQVGFDRAWQTILDETKKIRLPAECAACPKRKMCRVCAAVCVTETGGYDKAPVYVCRMTDEIIRASAQERERMESGSDKNKGE